jgi:hypothetical protein
MSGLLLVPMIAQEALLEIRHERPKDPGIPVNLLSRDPT